MAKIDMTFDVGGGTNLSLKLTDKVQTGAESSFSYTPTITKGLVEAVFVNNANSYILDVTSTGNIEVISKDAYRKNPNGTLGICVALVKVNSAGTITYSGAGLFYPIFNEYESD